MAGPAHVRRFGRLPWDAAGLAAKAPTAAGLARFLRSRAFYRFLHDTSELDLTAVAGDLRRVAPGDYTLCRDTDPLLARAALDVVLTVGPLASPASSDAAAAAATAPPALDDEGFEVVADDDGSLGSIIYMVRR